MTTTPHKIIRIDASSLKEMDCSEKFRLFNLEGYTSSRSDHKMEWGSAFHKFVADWLKGASVQDAMKGGLEYFAKSSCDAGDDWRNASLLIKVMGDYAIEYKVDNFRPLRVNNLVAVELPFKIPFLNIGNYDIIICGVIDAVGHIGNSLVIKDIKTTATKTSRIDAYFRGCNISIQMMLYSYALKTLGICDYYPPAVIDGVFISEAGSRLRRSAFIDFRAALMDEFIAWVTERCHEMVRRAVGEIPFTKNFAKCNGQFGMCQFYNVCTAQSAYREQMLESNFHRRVYDPATFGQQET